MRKSQSSWCNMKKVPCSYAHTYPVMMGGADDGLEDWETSCGYGEDETEEDCVHNYREEKE